MRTGIRKQLLDTFQHEFEKRYPQFSLLKLASGSPSIWAWPLGSNLTFFVGISPFEDEDAFALEIAWSENVEFPWSSIGEELIVDKSCWRGRLGQPEDPWSSERTWDLVPEEEAAREERWQAYERGTGVSFPPSPAVDVIVSRLPTTVDNCLESIKEHGFAVFQGVAQARGLRVR